MPSRAEPVGERSTTALYWRPIALGSFGSPDVPPNTGFSNPTLVGSTSFASHDSELHVSSASQSVPDYCVYALINPGSGLPIYIGKTVDAESRFARHVEASRAYSHHNPRLATAIRFLLSGGTKPELLILERFQSPPEMNRAELSWIDRAREYGWPIFNVHQNYTRDSVYRQEAEAAFREMYREAVDAVDFESNIPVRGQLVVEIRRRAKALIGRNVMPRFPLCD